MAVSNRDRVGRAFEAFAAGVGPYVDRRLKATSPQGEKWLAKFVEQSKGMSSDASLQDPSVLLRVMADCWDLAFRNELRKGDRNAVFELREVRNRWAHNDSFTVDDAYRALDSIERVLVAVDTSEAEEVGKSKDDLMRLKYEAQAKKAATATKSDTIFDAPVAGLKPWREIVIPHEDVAQGKFALAEFAADLSQVHHGQGSQEYINPVEFYRRTFLTTGLRRLLREAAERVTGAAGVPVVELQTNFGGGKTHSMIALYHLFSGLPIDQYPQELQDVLHEAGVTELPSLPRVVLVGTKLKAGQPDVKEDGTEVRTMWGELAWQLGGRPAFDLVAESDRTSTNPGDALDKLLSTYGPCLILIDEWVAYARQLYADDSLPGGTFDTHFSFAQALTEAVRRATGVLLVVSIPASENADGSDEGIGSEIEVGGVGGREALRRLRNVVGRMESSWRPASAEESFEIVRRRLFQPIDPALLTDRDTTALRFGDYYRKQAAEFPGDCRDPRYVDRIKAAYPIHPELFARLYEDWSTLDRFQRTRGVLRLMAAVIHASWASGDQAPLILPGNVPLEDAAVSAELERVLEDNWKPIIDRDIDGPGSLPAEIDKQYPNLQQRMATRRVARAVFLGSAPTLNSPNRGIEAQRVRLGCALPGEPPAIFGDALGKLAGRATYLYQEGNRYWYAVQESVNRTANDLAESFRTQRRDEVHMEIIERLKAEREKGDFSSIHPAPQSSSDVGDEPEVRLVILDPETPHIAKSEDSPAMVAAQGILERRGNAPRAYRNMLVFLAPDQRRLDELEQAAAEFLAWRTIDDQAEERNLDAHQRKQASTKRSQVDEAVRLRIAETYHWVLVPSQPDPASPTIVWDTVKVDGQYPLAVRASRKLGNEGLLQTQFAPVLLRMELDGPLARMWEDGHVRVAEVWDCFAKYIYLPRLRDVQVLLTSVEDGPASTVWQSEGFAVAAEEDAKSGRYLGLATGGRASHVTIAALIVQPEFALGQLEQEARERAERAGETTPGVGGGGATIVDGTSVDDAGDGLELTATNPTRFHGTVTLQADRLNREFGKVVQEVIEHLAALVGGNVDVTVDIAAQNDDGYPDHVVRAVTENARTLKFDNFGFEDR